MMASLNLFLLGSPRVEQDNRSLTIRRRKALALLSYLAVTGETQRRDTLATLLWPDHDQSQARAALTRHLSELRKIGVHDHLISSRDTVTLAGKVWLDVAEFQQLLAACTGAGPNCLDPLTKAVALYRDDFLKGFTLPGCPDFDEWQFFQTEELRQQLVGALERLITVHSRLGDYDVAIPCARRWLALDPLHEPAHRQLIQLYARSGQWSAAIRQYEICCQLLDTELGVVPLPETVQLYETIKAKRFSMPAPVADGSEPASTLDAANNLPSQATPFLGREIELAALIDLISDPEIRLIAIAGSGGMGKTRLALACAEQAFVRENFLNGICFVGLAPLGSSDHIIPTMAEALGFHLENARQTRSPRRQVLDYLRQKQMLMIVDNCEHLLDGMDIITDILQAAPGVKILATSRERLRLREEQVYPIQGLEFPDWETPKDVAEYTAVKLFLQSARRVMPNFELASDDLRYLVRICRLVEGMPLGIELAASWVDTLSITDIAAEIEQSLDFLETEMRNVPDRHRSIRAVFESSWKRMSETEQALMAQFSIFRGGFTRDAAQQITDASLRSLSALTNQSLLQYETAGDRYHVHELLRQYSAQKLAEKRADEAATRNRHSAYYAKTLHRRESTLRSAQQLTALTEIKADIENISSAWDWAVAQGQIDHVGQALESLGQFYEWYGRYQDGEVACRAALGVVDEAAEPLLRIKVLSWQATFCYLLGQIEEASKLWSQSSTLLDSPQLAGQDARSERAAVLLGLGQVAGYGTIDTQAMQAKTQLWEQSLAIYEALQDRWGMAKVMITLCMAGRELQEMETVEQWWQQLAKVDHLGRQCTSLCREIGNQAGLARVLVSMGMNSLFLRSGDEVRSTFETAVDLCHALDLKDTLLRATSLRALGLVFLGDYADAQITNQTAHELAHDLGNFQHIPEILRTGGLIALVEKRYGSAQQSLQASLIGFQEAGNQFHGDLTLAFLGIAEQLSGNTDAARRRLIEALRLTTDLYSHVVLAQCSLYLAVLHLAHQDAGKRAVEIYSLLSHLWLVDTPRFFDDLFGHTIDMAASSLSAAEVAEAQERGRALDLWATARAVLAELEERT